MALHTRNILSLCAGVGGLELGILLALAHRGEAGRGICYVEREAAAAASLVASMEAGWFHQAPVWSDMLTFDAKPWRGLVHILASGDPCQDNSVAGKRAGAAGDRFLAPEVCRLADECRPDVVFRENVPGNADGQLAAIVPPLERLGYRVAAGIFSSAATGNTMRRERLFIMAIREGGGRGERGAQTGPGSLGHADGGGAGTGRMDGAAGAERGAFDSTRGTDRRNPLPQWPEGSVGAREPSQDLGSAESDTRRSEQQSGSARRGRPGPARTIGALGRPDGGELQGQRPDDPSSGQRETARRHAPLSGGATLPPAIIPGPTDSRWRDVLDRYPEYQPALSEEEAQSHLRRGIDALAHRVERLRATGNGVDPLVAATAFLFLGNRLGAFAAGAA